MKNPKNSTSCVYETKLWGACRLITVTWHKTLFAQRLTLHVADGGSSGGFITYHVDKKPWFSWKKEGRKTLNAGGHELELFWNLNHAKFGCGPEPQENFYVSLVSGGQVVLLLGDMQAEAYKRTRAEPPFIEPVLLSRKAHIFGKKCYTTTAQFGDKRHEIVIECQTGGPEEARLYLSVDKHVVLKVKHLAWKFRGNRTISIDGEAVEFFWDVHNWLFDSMTGHAVFMFQTCPSTDGKQSRHDEQGLEHLCCSSQKKLSRRSCGSSSSVMQWVSNGSEEEAESRANPGGFSLLLYAWKNH